MSKENIQLTPLQLDYKELIKKQDKIATDAKNRMVQIRKEIATLENESYSLEAIIDATSKLNSLRG
tara:strand:- start:666 stop:863 length:198 start_codon:yes stop_codon:yes gene_type:complete